MPEPQNVIRVFLVDDHQMLRAGLRLVIQAEPGLQVVGEACEAQDLLSRFEHLQPDVIVMDIGLPDMDGIALSREVLARWPQVKIVILSALDDRQHLEDALAAGVAGYLLKVNATNDLIRAIRAVMQGQTYFSQEMATVLAGGYKELLAAGKQAEASLLSDREREVLRLVAEGRNTKEIASALGVSIKTVESHRTRLMSKLNLHSVAELTKYAIRKGLTSP